MTKTHTPAPERLPEALSRQLLESSLQENITRMTAIFIHCSDLIIHEFVSSDRHKGCIVYMDGLVQKSLVDRDVLAPLLKELGSKDLQQLAAGLTPMSDAHAVKTVGEAVDGILCGDAVLLMDGSTTAIRYGVRGWESRGISEPSTESTIRGPRDAFVETLRFNTALLRRKIKSSALKLETLKVGQLTQTDVVLAYLDGVADPQLIQEVKQRITRIEIDGVLEGGYLEQFMEDAPWSPFPQLQYTERPDVAAANLLEGRVVILVDGTPFVLIAPVVFAQFLQAAEDYYERPLFASVIRLLRYVCMFVALLLPSVYVAISTFHPAMIPADLLLSLAAAREAVPFPALVEALLMEVSFEILREAGIRLPRPVGSAVSIVGALVLGDAAVRSGIISQPMVIVVATTGIASFAIPRYSATLSIRLLRFPILLLGGTLGLFGVMAGVCALLLHLCALRSFGVPYLTPIAPLQWQGLRDMIIRAPLWWLRQRPRLPGRPNPVRQAPGLQPGLHQPQDRGT